jgi:uncharacterized membrane protein YkvA (DUF1232 family)
MNSVQNSERIETKDMNKEPLSRRVKAWAARLIDETYALYYACRDPRTPWYAKALAGFVVAHTLSPVDTIPDFIPVLGMLDDLIITPLGLAIALRMIPAGVMQDARRTAAENRQNGKIVSKAGLFIVIGIWVFLLALLALIIYRIVK